MKFSQSDYLFIPADRSGT